MKKSLKSFLTILLALSMLMSNFAMIATYAVIDDYPVELAFNNIFVFEKWANNALSTSLVRNDIGRTDKSIEITDDNIRNGSFRIENTYDDGEIYTGFSMGTGADAAGNYQFYYMEVAPDSAYTFALNVTALTASSIQPYVFFYNENNEYISHMSQQFNAAGAASFVFTTPLNAHYIQIRFTLPNKGYADVKDIAIRKSDVSYGSNIFNFDAWAGNALSGKVSDDTNYNGGNISKNTTANSVTLTTNVSGGILFTNFTFDNGNGYYMMPVESSASYSFSYNLASCDFEAGFYQPYVVYYDASYNFIEYYSTAAAGKGANKFLFKTPGNAAYIQIVYGIMGAEADKSCTVKDVAIQKITISENADANLPHRQVYTYSASTPATYGTLPTPSYAPAGYVFAGWYTGKDGTGTLITENTSVDFSSHTVYPKYEPIVDSLAIRTYPIKENYAVNERVNLTGLVLLAKVNGEAVTIDSGYRCTPEYLTATGKQTITVHYGGKTATYTVNVSANTSKSILINGSPKNVNVADNVYTLDASMGAFNKYKLTYYSDSYVKGIMTYSDNSTEEFFLEPTENFNAENGEFSSFIDGYLEKHLKAVGKEILIDKVTSTTKNGIKSISFELLDNKSGSFDLLSVTTSKESDYSSDYYQYFDNGEYMVGIDILNGGVVAILYALTSSIEARVYIIDGKEVTKVDYAHKLDEMYSGYKIAVDADGKQKISTAVNLINLFDTGRYLQQSYYGTGEKPYEQGFYNNADWNYNPVQGGNVAEEASKVIDFEIGSDYIYVKTRPLDWSKWSDDFATVIENNSDLRNRFKEQNPVAVTDSSVKRYGDEYVTDTYVESKYVFEDGMMKVYNRMVDYSGLPSAQTTQELPAFYTIEPLNEYVYNDVEADEAWNKTNLKYESMPEFWGVSSEEYIKTHYTDKNLEYTPNQYTPEHWAAFMASRDSESFGIGLYSPEVTNFFYGIYPEKYAGVDRHAKTIDPAWESNTSYIAPIDVRTFQSYKPTEYSYYISTGTINEIRDSFGALDYPEYGSATKEVQIGVPETIYMTPSTGESKTGLYFVNNRVQKDGTIIYEAKNDETKGEISVYAPGSTAIKFIVKAVSDGIGEPTFGGISDNTISTYEDTRWAHSVISGHYGTGAAQDWFVFDALDFMIEGKGLTAGNTATLEWEITVYYGDSDTTGETHYAYTTLYAPWYQPVGAASKAVGSHHNTYASSILWVSGAHDYSDGDRPVNNNWYVQTANFLPMIAFKNGGYDSKGHNPDTTWIQSGSNGLSPTMSYNSITESGTNYHARANTISPTANLTVDTSRYNNFNQIPNFKVGFMVTDRDGTNNDSDNRWYISDYGTNKGNSYYNGTARGGSKYTDDWNDSGTIFSSGSNDRTPSTKYNDPWNKVISGSGTYRIKSAVESIYDAVITSTGWNNNFVNINVTAVNKVDLRYLVQKAASLDKNLYTTSSWDNLMSVLPSAAGELGNPTDADVAEITKNLEAAIAALETNLNVNVTFDNMFDFSSFNIGSALTVNERTATGFTVTANSNQTDANTGFSNYIKVEPGKTYIFSADLTIQCAADDTKGFDMYINTLNANKTKDLSSIVDTSNGAHTEGDQYISLTGQKVGASNTYIRFTAGSNTHYIRVRFDANTTGNKLSVNNIRVYEDNGVSVTPPNKHVKYGTAYGELPTPVKAGYDFVGWYHNNIKITSTSILNSKTTVNLISKWKLSNSSLVDDIIVSDFGMPVTFNPFENDSVFKEDIGTTGSYSLVRVSGGVCGTFAINGNNITYTPTKVLSYVETAKYTVNYTKNGVTDTLEGTIRIYPATDVYYEDDFGAVTYKNGVAADNSKAGEWSTDGASKLASASMNLANDVYGYADAYKTNTDNFSMGSAQFVSVNKYNNPQNAGSWPEAQFTFAGTGFDIVSLISKDTGTIQIQIYEGNSATGTPAYNWILDTYYGYSYVNGEWEVSDSDDALYQIPVLSRNDLDYGVYTVKIIPTYTSYLDHQRDGSYDFYLDAIRVYNPMGTDPEASSVYSQDGEYVISHESIRDILVSAGDLDVTKENSVVYINKTMNGTFEQYAAAGPKNEVYLAKGQSVAFNLTVTGIIPSSVQVSAHALNGTASMHIGSGNSYSNAISISHKTALYYEMPFAGDGYWTYNEDDNTYTTKNPIVITNNSDSLLSLCNIKVTTDGASAVPVMYRMTPADFAVAAASAETLAGLTPDDGALFVPDDVNAGTDADVVEVGETVSVTITTSAEVYALTVNGENAVLVSENEDGSKNWSYTYTTEARGEQTFALVAYNSDGFASEETTVTVDVQSKIQIFFTKLTHFFSMIFEFLDKLF